jgi:hypothetical protein
MNQQPKTAPVTPALASLPPITNGAFSPRIADG